MKPAVKSTLLMFIGAGMANASFVDVSSTVKERPVTNAPQSHMLTNVNVWSPDSRWIVYDVRSIDSKFDGTRIERINVDTGEVECLYEAPNGATCGVVTFDPRKPRVVFIVGPEHPTSDWSYGVTRRRGLIVEPGVAGGAEALDAMNYAPPFTAGALRGGSHVHVFSPDGAWVSFTYEDEVLARLATRKTTNLSASSQDVTQRNVGVAIPGPVKVSRTHPRNNDGTFFSVLVTRTGSHPQPGSDEISRAFEDAWVGDNGYARANGTRQLRALAFQGQVVARDGRTHAEVFIVDLPNDLTRPAQEGALQGSETRGPAPPRGVVQRRLTYTSNRNFPGIVQAPRHWLRSSPDGSEIAFLMSDDRGVVQLWSVSPNGGQPRQITAHEFAVSSAFTWSPDGRWLAHVMDRSVCITEVTTGDTRRLTAPTSGPPQPQACVYSPDGRQIALMRLSPTGPSEFLQIFVVGTP